jgi:hypothetical protein
MMKRTVGLLVALAAPFALWAGFAKLALMVPATVLGMR